MVKKFGSVFGTSLDLARKDYFYMNVMPTLGGY